MRTKNATLETSLSLLTSCYVGSVFQIKSLQAYMIPRDANIIKYKCIEYVDDIDWTLCFKINATRGHKTTLYVTSNEDKKRYVRNLTQFIDKLLRWLSISDKIAAGIHDTTRRKYN